MSVIMTLRVHGDAAELERLAAADPSAMKGIIAAAKEHGAIAHRFYASDDGQLMVLDEWPDAESFKSFFAAMQAEIGPMMEAVGVREEPEIVFWRELDTHDKFGWGA